LITFLKKLFSFTLVLKEDSKDSSFERKTKTVKKNHGLYNENID